MHPTTYTLTLLTASRTITATALFPPDHLAFQGHFPGNPILPAFMQVQLALDTLEAAQKPHTLRELSVAKFLRPLPPDALITIILTTLDEPTTYDAELRAANETVSTFTLRV